MQPIAFFRIVFHRCIISIFRAGGGQAVGFLNIVFKARTKLSRCKCVRVGTRMSIPSFLLSVADANKIHGRQILWLGVRTFKKSLTKRPNLQQPVVACVTKWQGMYFHFRALIAEGS